MKILKRLLLFIFLLGAGSVAMAQQGPSKSDLKPIRELPKMAPAPTVAGMLATVNAEDVLVLDLSSGGRVRIVMRPDVAPHHIERIRTLARQGFYDGTVFHRVIEGFMAQGGDPTGTGQGGSKLPDLKAEFNDLPHVRGALAMARAQSDDSANSQFYIVLQPVLKLDRTYTIWGRVVSGMQWVDAIAKGEPPANPTKIIKASIEADKVPPPAPSTPIPAPALAVPPGVATPTVGNVATPTVGNVATPAPQPPRAPQSPPR